MKIALLGSAYPLRGGLSSYNERLARQFQNEGNEVKIFTFSLQYPSIFFPGKTQFSDSPPPTDLKIEECLNSINPISWLWVAIKIMRYAPDILLIKYWLPFMGPCLGTVARLLAFFTKTKVITIIDNMIPHEKRLGDNLFTSYYVGGSHAFLAMSESVLKDIDVFDKKKPRTLHPHPLFDNFGAKVTKENACEMLGLDPELKYVLFFGFIRAYKGLDLLMKAIHLLGDDLPDLRVLVAGEFYDNEKTYKDLEAELSIQKRLVWHNNFISDEDVCKYFGVADLVVQPYKTATQSGVTQIAYHFDKPMIVTNVGGLPELVPDGKVGFVAEVDPESIAVAIKRFFKEADQGFIVESIKKHKLRFSWDSMYNKILELYHQLS
ncbi:MAG TPA: glycosyltransferase [Bacteroidetes bacterium]|nr:glycosyltransferase [Bacteroidota bacterium]